MNDKLQTQLAVLFCFAGLAANGYGQPTASLEDLDGALQSALSGKRCYRAEETYMLYPRGDVSISRSGVLNVTVENWNEGKMTTSYRNSARITNISEIKQGKDHKCHTLDLKCNRYFISSKGKLSRCVDSSSLGSSDNLRLYFDSKSAASEFRELLGPYLSVPIIPEDSELARIPDGRVVVQPPGTIDWVLEDGKVLGRGYHGLVIAPNEEMLLSGSAAAVRDLEEQLSQHAYDGKCRFKSFIGSSYEKNRSKKAITIDTHGVITRAYQDKSRFSKPWVDAVEAVVIANLDLGAAKVEGDSCLQLIVPCRKGFSNRVPVESRCVSDMTLPESVIARGALSIPVRKDSSLDELKRLLNSAAQNFTRPGRSGQGAHSAGMSDPKPTIKPANASVIRNCGSRRCVRVSDGRVLIRTKTARAWFFEDGRLAPRNLWPEE